MKMYNYEAGLQAAPQTELCPRNVTSRERLVQMKNQLEGKLSEINEAIAALDSNPEFEKVHNLLARALNY